MSAALSSYVIGRALDTLVGTDLDSSGNIYVTGSTNSAGLTLSGVYGGQTKNTSDTDAFVAKYNASGVLQWGAFIGGAGIDFGQGISSDSSGNAYVTGVITSNGYTLSGVNGGETSAGTRAFVAKYDISGVLQWGRIFPGSYQYGQGISNDSNGNVYTTGYYQGVSGFSLSGVEGPRGMTSSHNTFAYLTKYDTNGVLQWGTFIGDANSHGYGVSCDSFGVYVTGDMTTGTLTGQYGGDAVTSNPNGNGPNAFIAKYNDNGELQWGRFIGGERYEVGRGVSNDSDGNIYVLGSTNSSFTLSGISGGQQRTGHPSNNDIFLAKYNRYGNIQWGVFIGAGPSAPYSISADDGYGVSNDTSGNVYVTGTTQSGAAFTLSGVYGGFTITPGSKQGFVAKYNDAGVLQWAYLLNSLGYSAGYAVAANTNTVVIAGITNTQTPTAPLTSSLQSTNLWGLVQTFTTGAFEAKADPTIATPPSASAITYGQTLASSSLTGGVASVGGSFAFTTPSTVPNAGTALQEVTFTPNDLNNYNAVTFSVNVTAKINPTITTQPNASAITYGQTLASSSLTGGVASVAGSFAFNTPSMQPNVGTASQDVTFTPTNTTSYNAVTFSVNVTVNKAASTIAVSGATENVFTGSALGPNAVLKTGSTGAVTYQYVGTAGTVYNSSTRPTNIGSYSVTATLAADSNYNGAVSVAFAFTIANATTVSFAFPTYTYTYNGTVQGPNTCIKTGATTLPTYDYVGIDGTSYAQSATRPKNAGTYRVTVTVPSTGTNISATGTATFTINASAVTLSNISTLGIRTKVYDGTVNATLTGSPSFAGWYEASVPAFTLVFANKNVGAGKQVTMTLTVSSNYTANPITMSGAITAKPLTITGVSGVNKVFNNTTTATVSGTPALAGTISGDDVSITGTVAAVYQSATVGTSKPITVSGYTLGGAAAANYSVTQPTGLTASITKATATISMSARTVVYAANTKQAVAASASGVGGVVLSAPTVSYQGTNVVYGPTNTAPINVGIYSVTATRATDATYNQVTATVTLTIEKALAPMPLLIAPTNVVYNAPPIALPMPSNIAGPVVYSVVSGPVSLLNNVATITGAGPVVLAANVPGSANYDAAEEQEMEFNVGKARHVLSGKFFIANKVYGVAPFAITPPTCATGDVTLDLSGSAASIDGTTITITGVGQVTVTARVAADANYSAASKSATFTVTKAPQVIGGFVIANKTYNTGSFVITPPTCATGAVTLSKSGGAVTLTYNVVTGYTAAIQSLGQVIVTASVAESANYLAASKTAMFSVTKGVQTITPFAAIASQRIGTPLTITPPTASSGLPVVVRVKSGKATIQGNSVSFTGTGNVVLVASQAGNNTYLTATAVTVTFAVTA